MHTKTFVKICGIRFVESAVYAFQEGADFIGLVFHPKSKRFVDLKTALRITEAVSFNGAIPVAVMVDQNAKEIMKICKKTGITHVQFHGDTAIKELPKVSEDIIKILAVKVTEDGMTDTIPDHILSSLSPKKDYLLYDGQNPGSGSRYALEKFNPVSDFRFFIAGGLNEENVREVITSLNPFGIDVSSGVEIGPGVKDPSKIKQFIKKAREQRG